MAVKISKMQQKRFNGFKRVQTVQPRNNRVEHLNFSNFLNFREPGLVWALQAQAL